MKTTYEILNENGLLDLAHVVGANCAYSELLVKASEDGMNIKELITYILEQNQKMYSVMLEH